MNNQLHNQIKQLSDRELLEGIYQMLLVVMQEQLVSDSKQLGINVIADLLVDNMYRNRERNENNNNDVTGDKTKTPIFFSNTDHNSGWISSAFYNSFGFDSVPTKQNDGFTEQDLINYVLENLITK